jgi:MFS transporter, SP family, general alpha glucoside:H+ symporter
VMRLSSAPTKEIQEEKARKTVALMIETNRLEQEMDEKTSWAALFTGTDLWRTEVAAVSWGIQITSGFVIQGYATYVSIS